MRPAFLTPLYESPGTWASAQFGAAWTDQSAPAAFGTGDAPLRRLYGEGGRP